MNRWVIGVLVLLISGFSLAGVGAVVELYDGRSLQTDMVSFDGAYLVIDQDTIPRSEIKTVVFETTGGQETGSVSTDADVQELLEQAAQTHKRFPDAKGLLLIDDGKNTLHQDGTRNYSYHLAYQILSEARKSYATFRHYLREGDNEVKIHFARVIKPSGRVIELDHSTIKIETPPREDIVFFGKNKWVTFTLPQVQVGDIVEYSYENIQFNPWSKEIFDAGYYFEGEDPFIYSRLTVDVPEDEFLKWKVYNDPEGRIEFSEHIKDGRRILTWVGENSPPYTPEPNSPPSGDFLTRLDVVNQEDWGEIHDWYAGFQNERLSITPQIQALVDSLTMGAENDHEKIAPIYHWLQHNVRYISIKGSASSGVSGHPAQFTLERGFGDCTDKAILFSTMLRAAGIDADPVYLGTNDEVTMLDPQMPSYYGNHCITEVFLSDTSFYLDATGSSNGGFSRYPSFDAMDHGVYAVNSQKRKVEIIPVSPPSQQLRTYTLDMEIDENGTLMINYQSFYEGDYETALRYYWNYLSREEDRRVRFEQMVKGDSPDAELIDYELINVADLDKRLSLKITYKIPDYVTFAGPVGILYMPEAKDRLVFDEVSLATRNLPLTYATSEAIQHKFSLKLPEGWKVEYLPPEIDLQRPEVSYTAAYSAEEDNTIRFEDHFSRSERIIQPKDYTGYRNLLNSITSYHEKPILIDVEGGGL